MKVEFLTSYFEPYKGGIETLVLNLAEGLAKRGHKVYIHTSQSTPGPKNLKEFEKHKYYTIRRYREYPYSLLFPKFFHNDSILGLFNYSCLMNDYVALRYPNRKKVLSPIGNITYDPDQRYHKTLAPIYDKFIGSRTLKIVDSITAMTQFEKKGIIKKYPEFRQKVEIVAAGIQFTDMNTIVKKPFDFPYFVSVGRITATKRFEDVLRVLHFFPKHHYVLGGRDVGYANELLKLAENLGVTDRFHYLGELSENKKVQILAYGSVFIMPDAANAFGIANLEGFYYLGKVVAAKSGGMEELTKEFGGEVFPVGDLTGLKNSIKRILKIRQSIKQKEQLQKAIKQKYSWDAVVDAYEKVLLSLT